MNVGIVCDFVEEHWYSMDNVADGLMLSLPQIDGMNPGRLRPAMKFRFSRPRLLQKKKLALNLDRVVNRLHDYPRFLRGQRDFDVYHVIDHSYANLVHVLPANRVVVSCHDLDTFRCLFAPEQEPRSYLFRRMSRHILSGLQKAPLIACASIATRDALVRSGAVPSARLEVVPPGINAVFSPHPDAEADQQASALLGDPDPDHPEVLHVGSVIERKRIDVLLNIFAAVRRQFPSAKLIRAGGSYTAAHQALSQSLKIEDGTNVLPHVNQRILAALYRRASVTLLPSDREGFGLPVAEAMACGTPMVASDLPVLRETGGDAVVYCRAGDPADWVPSVVALLRERAEQNGSWRERVAMSVQQASRFTSLKYARRMAQIYSRLSRG